MPHEEDRWGAEPAAGNEFDTPAQRAVWPSAVALVLALGALVAAAVYLGRQWPPGHVTRVVGVVVPLALGLWAGIWLARRRTGFARLVLILAGGGLAGLAWWFVPTTGGLTLQAAQSERDHLLAELEALPLGDIARYTAIRSQSQKLANQFPLLGAEVQQAETSWLDRSRPRCLEAIQELPAGEVATFRGLQDDYRLLADARLAVTDFRDRAAKGQSMNDLLAQAEQAWLARSRTRWQKDLAGLKPGDLEGFTTLRAAYEPFTDEALRAAERTWFEHTYQQLPAGDFRAAGRTRALARKDPARRAQVRLWEHAWVSRTVDAALKEAGAVLEADPAKASTRLQKVARDLGALGAYPGQQQRLLQGRRQAAEARLGSARRETKALLSGGRYQAAAERAQHVAQALEDEARAVGLHANLLAYRDSCRFLADLARQARQPDPKP
jgi:hypothetical protein